MKTDYSTYHPSRFEWISILLQACLLVGGIAYLFYHTPLVLLPLSPLGYLYVRNSIRKLCADRQEKLIRDFRLMLGSLTVALRAGYSVENAFRDAERSLINQVGPDADMTRELMWINAQVRLSVPVEKLLVDFGRRSDSEDIENFAAVFAAAKRMGGNTANIVRETANTISSKIDVEREIETSIAAKKYEQKIMSVMPAFIILYMQLTSPDFLTVMYTSFFGRLAMTACLAVYSGALLWSAKIVDIRV